jgi:hypothetical protein
MKPGTAILVGLGWSFFVMGTITLLLLSCMGGI